MMYKRVIVTWVFVLSLSAAMSTMGEPQTELHGNRIAAFRTYAGGDAILLPVTLDGRTYSFLLDTGSTPDIFDISLRQHLGEPADTIDFHTPAHTGRTDLFRAPDALIGPLQMSRDSWVCCFDLSRVREITGEQIQGVLGIQFFVGRIVVLDFDHGIVEVWGSNVDLNDLGERFSLEYDSSHHLRIGGVMLGGQEASFMLDTGATKSVVVDPFLFGWLKNEGRIRGLGSIRSGSLLGEAESEQGILDEFRMGKFQHRGILVARGKNNKVGLRYLARYRLAIDLSGGSIYLKPGERFDCCEELPVGAGLRLMLREKRTVVHSVAEGSPASKADVRSNDEVVGINGIPADQFRLSEIRRLLVSPVPTCVSMTLRRDGVDHEIWLDITESTSSCGSAAESETENGTR